MNNHYRIEPLEEEELSFITKRFEKERKAYYFGMNIMLILTISIPVIVGFIYYIKFERTDLMMKAFFYAICIMIIIFLFIGFFSYMKNLFDIQKDVHEKTKIIESALITEKKYMALNHTYHFYLNSGFKYSIEVSETDFQRFEVDDEINIEYSRYSNEYFGYF